MCPRPRAERNEECRLPVGDVGPAHVEPRRHVGPVEREGRGGAADRAAEAKPQGWADSNPDVKGLEFG